MAKIAPTRLKSTFEGPSGPAVVLHWLRERHRIECGQGSDDEIMHRGRFCRVRRQDDRNTRWLHENWLAPHRGDPAAVLFLATVFRFCLNDSRIAGEIPLPWPWNPTLYLVALYGRKERGLPTEHYGHHAYTIYAYRGYDIKFEGHVACLLNPLCDAIDRIKPRAGDSCAALYARLLTFPGIGKFLAAQITNDCKDFWP
jgi:hypothetical protein